MKIIESLKKDKTFKIDLTYEKWLKDFVKPLTNNELNQMKKESANNPNYQPLQGA